MTLRPSTFETSEEIMIRLFAQPYNIDANGFFFESVEEYKTKSQGNRDRFDNPVEEYEIQFIDGDRLDAEFARAFGLNQGSFGDFLRFADEWEDHEKIRFIIAVGECGYDLDPICEDINQFDIDIYDVDSLKELAEQFVDDGLFGEVPTAFSNYIDYEAIARDLSVDYATTEIAGDRLAYRCG